MDKDYIPKYTIVGFVGISAPPEKFRAHHWPLHVTLLDTFKTEWTLEELTDALQKFAAATSPFTMRPSTKSLLGPNKDIPVVLLQRDENMKAFHNALLQLGDEGSFVYNTPEFVADGFVPHITDQEDEQASVDNAYPLTSISLVDMLPDGDPSKRVIIKTFLI